MRQKIIATGAALVLASLAAVGAFASQDGVSFLVDEPTVEPTATETIEATETATAEATNTSEATETAEPTASPTETGNATATPGTTETPDATATSDDGDEEDDDDIHGIPADNPNHVDDDGDGICEKGEAAVKTTPSGNQVRVPCHAADKSDHPENGNTHSDEDEEGDDETEEEDAG